MVDVISVLSGHCHRLEIALVTAICEFVQEETHLGLHFMITRIDALIEIFICLVEVPFSYII